MLPSRLGDGLAGARPDRLADPRPTPAGRSATCSRRCPATSCSSSSRRLAAARDRLVGLQERQLVRVFDVPEPVGPWLDRARVPAARTGSPPAARAGRRRGRRSLRGRPATFETLVGDQPLARITVTVPPRRRRRSPISTASARAIDELSTSWDDRLQRARSSTSSARSRRPRRCSTASARTRRSLPARRSPRTGRSATSDRIADLLADGRRAHRPRSATTSTTPAGRLALPRLPARAPGAARRTAAVLGHLGLQALDEQPYTVPRRRPTRCSSTTSACASPTRRRRSTTGARTELQDAFAALVDGRRRGRRVQPARARSPGSTRPPGHRAARPTPSTCARSGSRSASSTSRTRSQRHPALVADLVELFDARFDPALDEPTRPTGPRPRPRRDPPACCRRSTPSRPSTTTASAARS